MIKERVVVLNGYGVVQHEEGGVWHVDRVDKASEIKPGIYNLYLAVAPDKRHVHEGVLLYVDTEGVYQKVAKGLVRHPLADFVTPPKAWTSPSIRYEEGKAVVSMPGAPQRRGRRKQGDARGDDVPGADPARLLD
jgi:cell filamentation protein